MCSGTRITASRAKPVSVTTTSSARPSMSGTSWMWRSRLSSSTGGSTMAVYCVTSESACAVCCMTISTPSMRRSKYRRMSLTSSSLSRLRRIMLSTYSRYALSDGTRPAEVCGCSRYPSSSRSAISLRMVALERFRPERRLIDREPTGAAESTYSSMTALRIRSFLASSSTGPTSFRRWLALMPIEC